MERHVYMLQGDRNGEWATVNKKQKQALDAFFDQLMNDTTDSSTDSSSDSTSDSSNDCTYFYKDGRYSYTIYQDSSTQADPKYFIKNEETQKVREVYLIDCLLPVHNGAKKFGHVDDAVNCTTILANARKKAGRK